MDNPPKFDSDRIRRPGVVTVLSVKMLEFPCGPVALPLVLRLVVQDADDDGEVAANCLVVFEEVLSRARVFEGEARALTLVQAGSLRNHEYCVGESGGVSGHVHVLALGSVVQAKVNVHRHGCFKNSRLQGRKTEFALVHSLSRCFWEEVFALIDWTNFRDLGCRILIVVPLTHNTR